MSQRKSVWLHERTFLVVACLIVIATYLLAIDLKGISTDEGIRIGIMNGRNAYSANEATTSTTWREVVEANRGSNYQPLYFVLQNLVMRATQTQSMVVLKLTNVTFLLVSLLGLLALSSRWKLMPRLFLIGLFSFNTYLLMHVLQIREYILGVSFYIWSSWLVLKLDQRPLALFRADIGWFIIYAVFLIIGFYTQTWIVFIAIAQFLFLVIRPRPNRSRFFAHLAACYALVIYATLPFLVGNTEKFSVGGWGSANTVVWPQLSVGFHLLLSGHLPSATALSEYLFWFWIVSICLVLALLTVKKLPGLPPQESSELKRRGLLIVLCFAAALGFQIVYCIQVTNLSLWPRYFLIHYFFLVWLIGLGFNYLFELHQSPDSSPLRRRQIRLGLGALISVLGVSAVYQTSSYFKSPYLDTSFNRDSNWNVWADHLATYVEPDDLVISHDFISRATLTFTRPFTNEVIMLHELETADLSATQRIVYMESSYSFHERGQLLQRMRSVGFTQFQPHHMMQADGVSVDRGWMILIFERAPSPSLGG